MLLLTNDHGSGTLQLNLDPAVRGVFLVVGRQTGVSRYLLLVLKLTLGCL